MQTLKSARSKVIKTDSNEVIKQKERLIASIQKDPQRILKILEKGFDMQKAFTAKDYEKADFQDSLGFINSRGSR